MAVVERDPSIATSTACDPFPCDKSSARPGDDPLIGRPWNVADPALDRRDPYACPFHSCRDYDPFCRPPYNDDPCRSSLGRHSSRPWMIRVYVYRHLDFYDLYFGLCDYYYCHVAFDRRTGDFYRMYDDSVRCGPLAYGRLSNSCDSRDRRLACKTITFCRGIPHRCVLLFCTRQGYINLV